MNVKKIIILIVSMFTLSLAFVFTAIAENQSIWSFTWEGIDIEIYAPLQAYPGDNITLRAIVKSKEDLQDVYATIAIHGSVSEGYEKWTTYVEVLEDANFLVGETNDLQNFTVSIPSNVSSGLIYGHIYCTWKVYRVPVWKDRSYEDSFILTYIMNKEFEQLQVAYDELNATYNSLLANYTKLENYKSELGSTRNVMYILVATTVVSAATVLILLMRRPKRLWT
ncbi:hypothetical protein IBX38_03825 [Candidatus Bathyarchaeota archaeon]|nr:hypothetical protein [Candidatus Bathyarchaeota archaeon]